MPKDAMHEHEHIRPHHDASEGFDPTEPTAPQIWGFAIGSVVILVVVILALQQYFEKVWDDAVHEKVLAAPSEQLQEVRNRDEWALTHYQYQEPTKKQVRIPLERAEELFLKESAEGKTFYPAKPTAPKKEEPDVPAPGAAPAAGAGPTPGAAPTAPAVAAPKAAATKKK
jgi:hypothetical protein